MKRRLGAGRVDGTAAAARIVTGKPTDWNGVCRNG